ncbi:MAG: helix-hairpin-helix domain-containing protein [Gammaproteobacteria bacterium]|jgi:hypothetical protein
MKPAIIDIRGIGPAAVEVLQEHGINSVKTLAKMSPADLSAVPGFSETRAAGVIAAAAELLPPKTGNSKPGKKGKASKGGKKDKKNKKDKKGKRGKKKNK